MMENRKVPARVLRSWSERVSTIQRKAADLTDEMMSYEDDPAVADGMVLSDWADNIEAEASNLLDALTNERNRHGRE